jgi:hypothetical protein
VSVDTPLPDHDSAVLAMLQVGHQLTNGVEMFRLIFQDMNTFGVGS